MPRAPRRRAQDSSVQYIPGDPVCLRADGILSGEFGLGVATCGTPTPRRNAPMLAELDTQHLEATCAGGPPMMLPLAVQNASVPTTPYSSMICNKVCLTLNSWVHAMTDHMIAVDFDQGKVHFKHHHLCN